MKFSNEEMYVAAEDAIATLKTAMSELDGIEEYECYKKAISDIIDELESDMQPYKEAYEEEQAIAAEEDYRELMSYYNSTRL